MPTNNTRNSGEELRNEILSSLGQDKKELIVRLSDNNSKGFVRLEEAFAIYTNG